MLKLLSWLKVERVTKKMSEDKKEYDLKMQEYAQLLDIRADRIRVSITINHPLTNLVVVVCLFSVRFIDLTIYDHGGSVGTSFLPFLVCFLNASEALQLFKVHLYLYTVTTFLFKNCDIYQNVFLLIQ